MLLPVLEMGGVGVISVASHLVGEEMAAVVEAAGAGDLEEARRRDAALADLYAGLFVTTSPILIKAALEMIGLIPSGRLRLPWWRRRPCSATFCAACSSARAFSRGPSPRPHND